MQLEHLTKCQSLNEELKQVNDKHLRKEEMSLIVDSHFFFKLILIMNLNSNYVGT